MRALQTARQDIIKNIDEDAKEGQLRFLPHASLRMIMGWALSVSVLNFVLFLLCLDGHHDEIPIVMVAGATYLFIEVAKPEEPVIWTVGLVTWIAFGLALAFSRRPLGMVATIFIGCFMILSQILLVVEALS